MVLSCEHNKYSMFATGLCEICRIKETPPSSDQLTSANSEKRRMSLPEDYKKNATDNISDLEEDCPPPNRGRRSSVVQWADQEAEPLSREIPIDRKRRFSEPNLALAPQRPILKYKPTCVIVHHDSDNESTNSG